jgi:hypothetical protein
MKNGKISVKLFAEISPKVLASNKNLSLYVFGQLTVWIFNVTFIIALIVIIKLAIKATKALDLYINDKKNNKL